MSISSSISGGGVSTDQRIVSLAANATNATNNMAAAGLSVPVLAGHRYTFEAVLRILDASGLEGGKFDWDASTATATSFWCAADDGSSGFFSSLVTTLAADISATGFIDEAVVFRGSIEPATSGTLALRFSQVGHVSNQLVIARGSSLTLREVVI